MKHIEYKFLAIGVIAVALSLPISLNMQKRRRALDQEKQLNNGLNIQIKSLEKQVEEKRLHEEELQRQNEQLQKDLEAKAAREQFLAGLTFPVGNAPSWKVRDALAYYLDKGLTKTAAAYLVGNLVAESGLNETGTGDGGRALGLAQWHPNRRYDMPSGYHDQLAFVLVEMQRQTPEAYHIITGDPSRTQAAYAMKVFEAYGVEGNRFGYAAHILDQI